MDRKVWHERYRATDLLPRLTKTKSIGTLRKNLTEDIPALFKKEVDASLPFPASLIEKINKKEVDVLQRTFNLGDESRFSELADIFFDINLHFVMLNELQAACKITYRTQRNAKEFSSSSVLLFFLPGIAYLCDRSKHQEVPKRRTWAKDADQDLKKADRLIGASKELLEAASMVDCPPADGWEPTIQRDTGQWIKNHNLEDELKGLLVHIENKRTFRSNFKKSLAHIKYLPHHTKALTHFTKSAVDELSRIYQKNLAKENAVHSACLLLGLWGIKITVDAIKNGKQRRKKGDKL